MRAALKKRASNFHQPPSRGKRRFLSGFADVDRAADPRSFVRFLDQARSWTEIQLSKRRSFEILGIRKGDRVLDVGCGIGDDVRALGRMVGRTGLVVGVDSSETMIAVARKRAKGLNLPVEFHVCDAHRLDFTDNMFDGCRADRVFMHLKNPRQALSEMIRVARPGARIIVTEPDYDTLVLGTDDPVIADRIVNLIRASIRNGEIGHCLPLLFKELGLKDIVVGAVTKFIDDYTLADQGWRIRATVEAARAAGAVSATQAAAWLRHLEKASQAGRFWGAVTGFGVVGAKP